MIIAITALVLIVLAFGLVVLRGAPYVPSHAREVKQAFSELYPLGTKDMVIDVGSGDGIVLRLAAQRGARAIGYEINPFLVIISRLFSWGSALVTVELADFWFKQLPAETTLVYAFTVSRDVDKLADKLQKEANRLGKPLMFIIYGADLKHRKPLKKHRGHHLYEFAPLQEEKP